MSQMKQNLTNNELLEELKTFIKNELKPVIDLQNNYNKLESKIITLERKIRKNNIVIFGLGLESNESLVVNTINKLNSLLETAFTEADINNIYKIGNKDTTIVEFLSFLKKKQVFKNIRKLKNTNIYVADGLCKEDQIERKTLNQNLREAKSKQLNAYINKNTLYVNNERYTAKQLASTLTETNNLAEENNNSLEEEIDEILIEPKSNSAPSTPARNTFELEETSYIQKNISTGREGEEIGTSSQITGAIKEELKGTTIFESRVLRTKNKKSQEKIIIA